MYSIVVKPEAEQEIRASLAWYDEQKVGLGTELFNEISVGASLPCQQKGLCFVSKTKGLKNNGYF